MFAEALQSRLKVLEDQILTKLASETPGQHQQDNYWRQAGVLLCIFSTCHPEAAEFPAKRGTPNEGPMQTFADSEMLKCMSHPILLYDGVCGLCNRFVRFILRHDRQAIFRFAPLQSPLAARILARHGINPTGLDTVYVVLNPVMTKDDPTEADLENVANRKDSSEEAVIETLLSRSGAALLVLAQLGGLWRPAASLLQLLPKSLRDAAYNAVALHRYRIIGRSEVCPMPNDEDRPRFLHT